MHTSLFGQSLWALQQRRNSMGDVSMAKKKYEGDSVSQAIEEMAEVASPFLYDLCVDLSWNKVVLSCKTYPIDASYQDMELHETPLYVACQSNPPVRVVKALLAACPDAARRKSENNDLPIHQACRFNASIGVLRELIKFAPSSSNQETLEWGVTVLDALWDGQDTIVSSLKKANYATVLWQKVRLILEAVANIQALGNNNGSEEMFQVHTAVALASLGCPYQIFEFAVTMFPEQVFARDKEGRLPLHIAVGPTAHSLISRKRYKPRQNQVIGKLLELNPKAAKEIDPNGPKARLPVHTALVNCHQWFSGVNHLLEHSPEAPLMRDPSVGMYPFQLAAQSVADSTNDLATIFHLLRAEPGALQAPILRLKDSSLSSGIIMTKAPVEAPRPRPPDLTALQRRSKRNLMMRGDDSFSSVAESEGGIRLRRPSQLLDVSENSITSFGSIGDDFLITEAKLETLHTGSKPRVDHSESSVGKKAQPSTRPRRPSQLMDVSENSITSFGSIGDDFLITEAKLEPPLSVTCVNRSEPSVDNKTQPSIPSLGKKFQSLRALASNLSERASAWEKELDAVG